MRSARLPLATTAVRRCAVGSHLEARSRAGQRKVRVDLSSRRGRCVVRCQADEDGNDPTGAEGEQPGNGDAKDETRSGSAFDESAKKYREQLEQQGISKESARRILEVWKEKGTENPDQLRRLFVRGSLVPLGVGALQLLFDLGAAYGAFYGGDFLRSLEPFPLQTVVVLLSVGATIYFFTSALLEAAALTALGIATFQLGANADAFLAAVKQLADEPGPGVVGKAKKVVNTVKVVQALNALADVLMVRWKPVFFLVFGPRTLH